MQGIGWRFLMVAVLTVAMLMPLILITNIVKERKGFSASVIRSVGNEWGGQQLISGPQLVIPVTAKVAKQKSQEVINPTTNEIKREEKRDIVYQYFSETMIVNPNPVYIHPDDFSLSVKTETHIRHRGIFTVPVYSAAIEMVFDFNPFGALDTLKK